MIPLQVQWLRTLYCDLESREIILDCYYIILRIGHNGCDLVQGGDR